MFPWEWIHIEQSNDVFYVVRAEVLKARDKVTT
jgi:hypothetical protein